MKFAQFDLCIRLALVFLFTKFHKFPQIISENHTAYVAILNNICDLENQVKVTRFELGLCLAMGPMCTKFGESS